jgi:hypothetical protein
VTELLNSGFSKIHILLDMWTSRSLLSLCGIVAHFINDKGRYRSFLLSIPELASQHTGDNIADGVAAIITEFNISDKLGYFILDNALNNDTCIQALGEEFGFNWKQRRLRCAGHILNLVARSILYGKNPNALEVELKDTKDKIN